MLGRFNYYSDIYREKSWVVIEYGGIAIFVFLAWFF